MCVCGSSATYRPGRPAISATSSRTVRFCTPTSALDAYGCRDWDGDIEQEATFLAGALLIPGKAIWWAAKQGTPRPDIAEQYGCGGEMVQMRLNLTGAGKRFRQA